MAYLARKLSSRVCWRCLHCVSERIMSVPDKIAQELAGLHDDGELADGEAASSILQRVWEIPCWNPMQ